MDTGIIFLGLSVILGGVVMYQAYNIHKKMSAYEKILLLLMNHANAVTEHLFPDDEKETVQ